MLETMVTQCTLCLCAALFYLISTYQDEMYSLYYFLNKQISTKVFIRCHSDIL